jgi:hypothetical protein
MYQQVIYTVGRDPQYQNTIVADSAPLVKAPVIVSFFSDILFALWWMYRFSLISKSQAFSLSKLMALNMQHGHLLFGWFCCLCNMGWTMVILFSINSSYQDQRLGAWASQILLDLIALSNIFLPDILSSTAQSIVSLGSYMHFFPLQILTHFHAGFGEQQNC